MRLIDADALLEKIDNPYEYNEVARWVKAMPTENPGDCISRQTALGAIDDIHNEHLYKQPGDRDTYSPYNEGWSDACYRIDAVVSAMPPAQPDLQQTCNQLATDAISRQAALDAIYEMHVGGKTAVAKALPNTYGADLREIVEEIEALPSAQSMRWIPVDIQNDSPKENEAVLLGVRFRDDFKYFVTSRQDYNYWTGLGREIKGELRWQPLPKPYAERREE